MGAGAQDGQRISEYTKHFPLPLPNTDRRHVVGVDADARITSDAQRGRRCGPTTGAERRR